MIHRLDFGFRHGGVVGRRVAGVDSVLKKDPFAVHLFNDLSGSLAFAETGHIHFAHIFAVGLIHSLIKFFLINGDCQLHLVGFFFLNALQLHLSFLLCCSIMV